MIKNSYKKESRREILGEIPKAVMNLSRILTYLIVLILVVGAVTIKYKDTVQARVSIVPKNSFVHIRTKVSGKVSKSFVQQYQNIRRNETLAIIEDIDDYKDLESIKEKLKNINLNEPDQIITDFPNHINLGSIHDFYISFICSYRNYILVNNLGKLSEKKSSARKWLQERSNLVKSQEELLKTLNERLKYLKVQDIYVKRFSEVKTISKIEYHKILNEHLVTRGYIETCKNTILATKKLITNVREDTSPFTIDSQVIYRNKNIVMKNFKDLNRAILNWEEKFMLKSPVNGKVCLSYIEMKNPIVRSGNILFTLKQEESKKISVNMNVPFNFVRQLRKGNKVVITLDNYPHQIMGTLVGEIPVHTVKKQEGTKSINLNIDIAENSPYEDSVINKEAYGNIEIVVGKTSILKYIFKNLMKN